MTEKPAASNAMLAHHRPIGGARGFVTHPALAATSPTVNDDAWGNLYGAMISNLGLSPSSFQLLYPFMSWNWKTPNNGYTTAAQYDFCATIPQWSATGAYVSSGATFDGAYQQFLNEIVPATTDPTLQAQIDRDQNALTDASNDYQTTYAMAEDDYAIKVTGNDPTFTDWLAGAGRNWGILINGALKTLEAAQAVLNADIAKTTTPNLVAAQNAMANTMYYTKLQDPSLSGFPAVPAYSISMSSSAWVTQVQAGGAQPGSLSFSNAQGSYDYSKTWAGGSASVGSWFWSVYANGSWQQVTEFYTDSSLQCTISFKAWDQIMITPQKWYSGVKAFQGGPFVPNFTATQAQGGTTWAFGEGGLVPVLKTAMIVAYQPSVSIEVSTATYNSFQQQWSAAGGIQIGPFRIGGSGGGTTLNWSSNGSGYTMTATSTSTVPVILGVTVQTLP